MYRRFFAMMLCALILLGLTACGDAGAPKKYDDSIVTNMLPSNLPIENAMEPSENETKDVAQDARENTGKSETAVQEPQESGQSSETPAKVQTEDTAVSAPSSTQPSQSTQAAPSVSEPPSEKERKILIAYFTWAENTVVENPSAVDVDATTSASVLAPGHVAQMASWVQAETGGDLFSIVTTEPYSSNYDECLDRAADEKAYNARPSLTGSVANMAGYDVVFLGYPDWWSTCPMAVFTFLESYDFTGKTIIPFCAHGTSGLASSVRDIKAALPGVTVLDAVGVQRPGMDTPIETARSTVTGWLAGLND